MTEENTWYEQYALWAMQGLSDNVYIAIKPAYPLLYPPSQVTAHFTKEVKENV